MTKGLYHTLSQMNSKPIEPLTTENIIEVMEGLWNQIPEKRNVYVPVGNIGMELLKEALDHEQEKQDLETLVLNLFEKGVISKLQFDRLTILLQENGENYKFAKAIINSFKK